MTTFVNNGQLKLMEVPATATVVEVESMMVCGYCGGKQFAEGLKAERINGIRVHPKHEDCLKAVKHPMFDMSESFFQVRSG